MTVGNPEILPERDDDPDFGAEKRFRRRRLNTLHHTGIYQFGYPGQKYSDSGGFLSGRVEATRDRVWHGGWKRYTEFMKNVGGPFHSVKVELDLGSDINLDYRLGTGNYWTYSGAILPSIEMYRVADWMSRPDNLPAPLPPLVQISGVDWTSLRTAGATAIARTLPTAPSVSVAQTLGELKEGLPSLLGQSLRKGDIGGEYLNYQFGIVPTISDFKAYRETIQEADKILGQWYRDSGRRVRRRYTFPEVKDVTQTSFSNRTPIQADGKSVASYLRGGQYGVLTRTTTTTTSMWFSGAYSYYVPPQATRLVNSIREFDRLYGVAPTASTAWELLPWSWLIDWETNVGDVIKNLSYLSRDDLVLTYGYIMAHSRVVHDDLWRGNVRIGNALVPVSIRARVTCDVKQRDPASPYGVGWTGTKLSARQLAILAALGISAR